jgi:hypothetical protein
LLAAARSGTVCELSAAAAACDWSAVWDERKERRLAEANSGANIPADAPMVRATWNKAFLTLGDKFNVFNLNPALFR